MLVAHSDSCFAGVGFALERGFGSWQLNLHLCGFDLQSLILEGVCVNRGVSYLAELVLNDSLPNQPFYFVDVVAATG